MAPPPEQQNQLSFKAGDLDNYLGNLTAYVQQLGRNYVDITKWDGRNRNPKNIQSLMTLQRQDVVDEIARTGPDSLVRVIERARQAAHVKIYLTEPNGDKKNEHAVFIVNRLIGQDFNLLANDTEFTQAFNKYKNDFQTVNKRPFNPENNDDLIVAWRKVALPLFQGRLLAEMQKESQRSTGGFYEKIQPPHLWGEITAAASITSELDVPPLPPTNYVPGEFKTPDSKIAGKINLNYPDIKNFDFPGAPAAPALAFSAGFKVAVGGAVASVLALAIEARAVEFDLTNEQNARENILKLLKERLDTVITKQSEVEVKRIDATAKQEFDSRMTGANKAAENTEKLGGLDATRIRQVANKAGTDRAKQINFAALAEEKFAKSLEANQATNPVAAQQDEIRLRIVRDVLGKGAGNRATPGASPRN